jgi:hypothetical protein
MAELKTKATTDSVADFLAKIKDPQCRQDCEVIASLMSAATKSKPIMWGPAIVGFGKSKLKYADGRELDWMQIAFSPRKQNITLYLSLDFDGAHSMMLKLGKYKRAKVCLYIKRLSDVHLPTLRKIIATSVKQSRH